MAVLVGCGSFVFHTVPTPLTLWLDILPILIFQIVFIWNFCRRVTKLNAWSTVLVLLLVIGSALILRPLRQPMNGSLFYFPPMITLLVFAWIWAETSQREPWSLFVAALAFALAVIARSIDWEVDFKTGTHFCWHLMNGLVVYFILRTVVLWEARQPSGKIS